MSAPLILASASPRRRELLHELGVSFEVCASDVPEVPIPGESPLAFARRVAHAKAADIAPRQTGRFVLAADTVVVLDGAIFGKPADRDDARRMLRALSGQAHHVITAVALIDPCGALDELQVTTEVTFRNVTAEEIEAYLDSGEPFDKAGAYAVQGGARRFVVALHGSHSNVIGLPVDEVAALLRRRLPSPVFAVR